MGGTGTKAGVVNRDGEVLARVERRTDPSAGTKGIIAAVEEVLAKAADLRLGVEAVGVGAAGFVDAATGP